MNGIVLIVLVARLASAAELSFSEAVRIAADTSPGARMAAAQAATARAEARASAAWENPDLSVRHEPDQDAVELSVAVDVAAVARGGSVREAVAGADLRARASRAAVGVAGGAAWLDARRAEDRAEFAVQSEALAERLALAAEARVAAGEWSGEDGVVVRADAARLLDRALTWQQESANARARLAAILALPEDVSLSAWPIVPLPPSLDPAQLPGVVAADLDARVALSHLRAEQLSRIPVLRLDGGLVVRGAAEGPTYGASLTLPLFAPGAAPVEAARGRSDMASATADATRLDAVATVQAAMSELATAERLAQAWDIPGVTEALTATTRRFDAGEESLPDYLARRDLAVAAGENAIDARWRLARARLAVWELAGQLPSEASP